MARYDHLPIWRDAVSLTVLLEEAVRRFPRYHKYALGTDLRQTAYAVCCVIVSANAVISEEGYPWGLKRRVLAQIYVPAFSPNGVSIALLLALNGHDAFSFSPSIN